MHSITMSVTDEEYEQISEETERRGIATIQGFMKHAIKVCLAKDNAPKPKKYMGIVRHKSGKIHGTLGPYDDKMAALHVAHFYAASMDMRSQYHGEVVEILETYV